MNAAPLTDELRGRVVTLREQGLSYRRIGEMLRISHTSVANVLREAEAAGKGPVVVAPPAAVAATRVALPPVEPNHLPAAAQAALRPAPAAEPVDEIAALQGKLVQLYESADRAMNARDYAAHSTIVRSISMVTKDIAKLRGESATDPEQDKETMAAGKRAAERLAKLVREELARVEATA